MSSKTPTRLGKSPLVDAIFEIRFDGERSLSTILTGLLYAHFKCTDLERFPQADIPDIIRANDEGLKYALLNRMKWGNLYILTGDRSVLLSTILPYQGWKKFKSQIQEVIDFLYQQPFLKSFERFSFKYIDILEDSIHQDINDTLNIKISIGNSEFNKRALQLRTEIPTDNGVHIVQIISSANATLPTGKTFTGIMVDIDSIYNLSDITRENAKDKIFDALTPLHDSNKALFFELLTENGLRRLEPQYD